LTDLPPYTSLFGYYYLAHKRNNNRVTSQLLDNNQTYISIKQSMQTFKHDS